MKACSKCGVVKALDAFPRNPKVKDGLDSWCFVCRRDDKRARRKNAATVAAERERGRLYDRENAVVRRAKYARWAASNRPLIAAKAAGRRAAKLRATPSWACARALREWYEAAHRLAIETGSPWHVDHVIPLQSPFVCGLHVGSNFQLLPGAENARKHNRFHIA